MTPRYAGAGINRPTRTIQSGRLQPPRRNTAQGAETTVMVRLTKTMAACMGSVFVRRTMRGARMGS